MSIKKGLKYFAIFLVSVIALAVLCAAAYRYRAQRKILRARTIHSPDGINTVEPVRIGGIDQWIEVRGQSVKNPILLFIHGGPGAAFIPIARIFQDPWEKYFTVVQWDQRGAGRTYSSSSEELQRRTMTMERMNADTLEMVNYLCHRFARDKIFVLGHSWGSILGLRLAHEHPELLYAYIGVGQATDARQNEVVLYRDTLEQARRTQNKKAIQELTSIAPYPSAVITFKQIRIVREWSGALLGPSGADDSSLGPTTIFLAPEYSLINDLDWFRGQFFSVDVLLRELTSVNLAELDYDYRVPVFFLEGRHDPYTPSTLAKEFFDQINAPAKQSDKRTDKQLGGNLASQPDKQSGQQPDKQFIWFENSGHFPFIEEPARFTDVLVQKVLPLARNPRPAQ